MRRPLILLRTNRTAFLIVGSDEKGVKLRVVANRPSSPQKAEERDEEVELFGEDKDELLKILEDQWGWLEDPAVVAEAEAIVKAEEEEQAQEEKEAEKAEEEREAEVSLYCSGNPRDISVELRKLSGLSCMSTQELERMFV